jgi:hypothetical protein
MRQGSWCLVVIAIVVLAVALTGCTMLNASGNSQSSPGSGSSSAGGSTSSAAGDGTCPSVDAAHSWAGKWDSHATAYVCNDMRKLFYPATKDNPHPWGNYMNGDMTYPITVTQTGCDVTGSITAGKSGTTFTPDGCPITLTGKVDKDNVMSGTWKAYCDITFDGAKKAGDSGIFQVWMNPEGNGFAGTFYGNDPGIAKKKAADCPDSNGNWVGKRA